MKRNKQYTYFTGKLNTPVGFLRIIADSHHLHKIEFSQDDFPENNNMITKKTKQQLQEYFKKERKQFELPFEFTVKNFNTKIWRLLCTIPYGTTVSYKELAQMAGEPNAFRAVGNANHKNPLVIVVPCHRVIKSDGTTGGYGAGIKTKQFLLHLEKGKE